MFSPHQHHSSRRGQLFPADFFGLAPPTWPLVPPARVRAPLPASLQRAILKVARDFGVGDRWMNTEVALQWHGGLPPGMPDEIEWRRFGSLNVGLVGRRTLIALKLFAAVDDGPRGVHFQDLVALRPTREELSEAGGWVGTQDVSEPFHVMLGQVLQQLDNG